MSLFLNIIDDMPVARHHEFISDISSFINSRISWLPKIPENVFARLQ